jgi:magnesium chelatase accessory protein
MTRTLDWQTDGQGWPNGAFSRFVEAGGYRWHVQRAGKGPGILLLHGTGASTHSWKDLFPLLARSFDVLAMDLPGHGFTAPLGRLDASLAGMVKALRALLDAEQFRPDTLIGHSAGAAIAVTLAPSLSPPPHHVISINGALKPFGGPAALIAPFMAKALALNPLVPPALARGGRDPARVARLIEGTGSHPGPDYLEFYGRLFSNPGHVAGTLSMMANWNVADILPPFERAGLPLHQIIGSRDRAVPPAVADETARRIRGVTTQVLSGLGHLAHEEDAARVAEAILSVLAEADLPARRVGG